MRLRILAKLLEPIHEEFGIISKVVATITNSGSNFSSLTSPKNTRFATSANSHEEVICSEIEADVSESEIENDEDDTTTPSGMQLSEDEE
ncbi:hypothetical protein OUZ56_021687 [Daphnia magna]|uniref:Uncharacterized protein n=1 Tax=Daphnia magna TaxID=35525 RepID=A0ABR0AU89_9CRUS|nr:hypothetical protein OUZ56_021687 [Daphnia magna]